MNKEVNYFRLNYYLGLKDYEVDEMEGTRVDTYMICLQEINKSEGGSIGKTDRTEVQRAFMGGQHS